MTRTPLFLAALASSAVPGLDPVSVEAVETRPDGLFEVAYVQDSQDRLWVVKAPRTPAAGAMLDDITTLCQLLGRRLDVAVPMFRGHAPVPEGRAAVYLRVPGRPLDFAGLRPGPLAAEVGRTLAHVHNLEHLLYEEAGRPAYDAEAHRHRRLTDLDRAASTGHVPTGLLTRWERMLEDVSLWRFAPAAVHGSFTGDNVLASFDDDEDDTSGHVRGVLAWEQARIGDPADDFAALVALAPPETLDSVLEAYAQSRVERPDVNLVNRARLAAEMAPLATLLHALASGLLPLVEHTADRLKAMDAQVEDDDRRHAEEDAARRERTRQATASDGAGGADGADGADDADDADDPGVASGAGVARDAAQPLPDWDATQPHTAFPMLGETQYIEMATLLTDEEPGPPSAADLPEWSEPASDEERPEAEEGPRLGLIPEGDGSVPYVSASDRDGAAFEIDEVEALPEDGGVLDLHEGASDFVPVTERRHGDHAS